LLASAAGRWRRPCLALAGAALATVGLSGALVQHRGYFEASLRQQRLLAAIVRQAPGLRAGTLVLLVDTPPHAGRGAWRPPCGPAGECLELSLRYVYGRRDFDALFCAPGWPTLAPSDETCRFEREAVSVSYRHPWGPEQVTRRVPYDRMIVFESGAGGVRLM